MLLNGYARVSHGIAWRSHVGRYVCRRLPLFVARLSPANVQSARAPGTWCVRTLEGAKLAAGSTPVVYADRTAE